MGSAGTQTAGLAFGGSTWKWCTNATEHYDGSAWTAGGNMPTARSSMGSAGTQTAGFRLLVDIHQVQLMLPNIMMAQHGQLVVIWQQQDIN
jgi:hypothetical protein